MNSSFGLGNLLSSRENGPALKRLAFWIRPRQLGFFTNSKKSSNHPQEKIVAKPHLGIHTTFAFLNSTFGSWIRPRQLGFFRIQKNLATTRRKK